MQVSITLELTKLSYEAAIKWIPNIAIIAGYVGQLGWFTKVETALMCVLVMVLVLVTANLGWTIGGESHDQLRQTLKATEINVVS